MDEFNPFKVMLDEVMESIGRNFHLRAVGKGDRHFRLLRKSLSAPIDEAAKRQVSEF